MLRQSLRCFGGGGHGHHEQRHSNKQNTSYNRPTEDELTRQFAKTTPYIDRLNMWIHGRLPVDRLSDQLINDKTNTYSAYYHLGNNSLFHN